MFQQRSSSSLLTVLLILVAALSTPDAVAAQTRKLRKDGGDRERRLSMKSSKDSACPKSTKAGCVGIVFSKIPVQEKTVGEEGFSHLSYGNGRDWDEDYGCDQGPNNDVCDGWSGGACREGGNVATKAVAVGTTVYQYGAIGKEPTDGNHITFTDRDYYFHQQCTVLRGRIRPDTGRFKVNKVGDQDFDTNVPLKCDIFIHNGKGYTGFDDLPDTIHLRGYTEGTIDAKKNPNEPKLSDEDRKVEELYKVRDFVATVLGGTGRWAGSVGVAEVYTEGVPPYENPPDDVPMDDVPSGWVIELFATVSPLYAKVFNFVELPPKLDVRPEAIFNDLYDPNP